MITELPVTSYCWGCGGVPLALRLQWIHGVGSSVGKRDKAGGARVSGCPPWWEFSKPPSGVLGCRVRSQMALERQ
jgi:hypothetical protein